MRERLAAARDGRKGEAWLAVWGTAAARRELVDSPKASTAGAPTHKAKHTPPGAQASSAQQQSPSRRRLFAEAEEEREAPEGEAAGKQRRVDEGRSSCSRGGCRRRG